MDMRKLAIGNSALGTGRATIAERRQQKLAHHVGFTDPPGDHQEAKREGESGLDIGPYVSGRNLQLESITDPLDD